MAYTTINKSTDHFNTLLYTGNGSARTITGVGFQPDWVWIKNRDNGSLWHQLQDSVRGGGKTVYSNKTNAEATTTTAVLSFVSDGFTMGNSTGVNENGSDIVAWNWKAGGTAPAITYVVKVVSDSGNKYRFDDFGTSAVTLDLQEGGTYTFDQADSSNSGHPLRFYTAADKSGGEYTTGVTTNGTPGSSGAYTRITVAASAPTLYYQCSNHAGMGGQANTNSTFGSSNFKGAVQSLVSANTDAGFSMVKVSNLNSNTFGHGLNGTPSVVFGKRTDDVANWRVYYTGISSGNSLFLNSTSGSSSEGSRIGSTDATTVTSVGSATGGSAGTGTSINYCFQEINGFSKFGTYTGNGDASGPFIYTGFKPAWMMLKRIDSTGNWMMYDATRDPFNLTEKYLRADLSDAEGTGGVNRIDILSNGIKMRGTGSFENASGGTYFYMAFAKAPLVGSNNIPATAR
jgi:hypothetical protein|tara:strand:+ start:305 stop:1675 length:1371 start_codon:yes stop_codon:yes gene_type:complete